MSTVYLTTYKAFLQSLHIPHYFNHNRLQDVHASWIEKQHHFRVSDELLMSYDVCGSCEAHAILLHIQVRWVVGWLVRSLVD